MSKIRNTNQQSLIIFDGARRFGYVFITFIAFSQTASAAPPVDPLPAPLYSFDLNSIKVGDGRVDADAILNLATPDPGVNMAPAQLGLGAPGDDLDALSAANANAIATPDESFVLLFSVDANTSGGMAPDPDLAEDGLIFNVTDQNSRGQLAGDQFMTTALFDRNGAVPTELPLLPNSILVRNNFNEGGISFAALPATSASHVVPGAPQDNVDATANITDGICYFSVSSGSPSTLSLPNDGQPSGAHIYYNAPGLGSSLYATFSELGLVQTDDIDGIVVFDANNDGVFNQSDQVLFSLTSSSPSLATVPGASIIGPAADVFVARPNEPAEVFTTADNLGLCGIQDNVDALDFLPCDDADHCASQHGILGAPVADDDDDDDDEAQSNLRETFESQPHAAGDSHPSTLVGMSLLIELLNPDRAE